MRIGRNNFFLRAPKTGNATTDRALEEITEDVNRALTPIVRGELVKKIAPRGSAVDVSVPHRLGRIPEGWIVTRISGGQPTSLYEIASATPDRELRLRFSGLESITFDLWIF